MACQERFSQEVRERAVPLVHDHRDPYASQWKAILSIAEKIGCAVEVLRSGVRRTEEGANRAADCIGGRNA